jgi:hypothetical protein
MTPLTIVSRHTDSVMTALQWQGSSNNCGPFTTATVLNAVLGLNIAGNQLADLMNKPVFRGWRPVIRRIPNWATFPWGMVDVFREHGLNASWRFFVRDDFLRSGIEKGWLLMPVIGSLRPIWAHVMTLVMWNSEHGWGFANTASSQPVIYWMTDQEFQRKWRTMGRLLIFVRDVQPLEQ